MKHKIILTFETPDVTDRNFSIAILRKHMRNALSEYLEKCEYHRRASLESLFKVEEVLVESTK